MMPRQRYQDSLRAQRERDREQVRVLRAALAEIEKIANTPPVDSVYRNIARDALAATTPEVSDHE